MLYAGYPSGFTVLAANDLIFSTLQAIALFFLLKQQDAGTAIPAKQGSGGPGR